MFFVLIVFIGAVVLEEKAAVNICDEMDNILTSSELSVTCINAPKFDSKVRVSKREQDGMMWYDFDRIYQDISLDIDAVAARDSIIGLLEKNIKNTAIFKNRNLSYSIEEMIIYNVAEDLVIHDFVGDNYDIRTLRYNALSPVKSPNGVDIIGSSVYVRLLFSFMGFINRRHTVILEKCILLKYC